MVVAALVGNCVSTFRDAGSGGFKGGAVMMKAKNRILVLCSVNDRQEGLNVSKRTCAGVNKSAQTLVSVSSYEAAGEYDTDQLGDGYFKDANELAKLQVSAAVILRTRTK